MKKEELVAELETMGVLFYGHTIVSRFRMTDPPGKDARINFLVEKCGYKLVDEKGYFPKLAKETQGVTA